MGIVNWMADQQDRHCSPCQGWCIDYNRSLGETMNNTCILKATLLAVVACLVLFAQSDLGSITGFVKDLTGATVPNATVTVKNEATGTERRTTTSESGFYTVTNIPAGYYSVSIEAKGFKKYESTHNNLDPRATLAVSAPLTVGAAAATIEVTAAAQTLQTESAFAKTFVPREQNAIIGLNTSDHARPG